MSVRIFKLDDFEIDRHQDSAIQDAEIFRLFEGERRNIKFGDSPGYFFLLEGEIEVRLGNRSLYVTGGQAIWMDAGDELEIHFVHETTRGFRVQENYRKAVFGKRTNDQNGISKPASRRLAQIFSIRKDQTFSPNMMRQDMGDFAIRADPAALGTQHVKEIRENCDSSNQTIAFLFTQMPPGRVENFLNEDHVRDNLRNLRPSNLCIPASIISPFDRQKIDAIRKAWLNTMVCFNIGICFEVQYQNWSQGEFEIIRETLTELPPLHWGLVLDLSGMSGTPDNHSFLNRLIELLPWTRGIVCEEKHALQLMKVLMRHGFQGWMISDSV